MAKYLDKSGVTYLWNKIKGLFTDQSLNTENKTYAGAINEINTKVGNLTGAFLWKGKFDDLPAVTDYEAGNVVGVGKKEYVLTVTGNTKTWEEFGDEGSYLLKSVAEETYLKKAAGEVKTDNLANGAVTEDKIADGSITGDKFSPGLTLYMNKQFNYLRQVQVKYGEDPSAAIKSFTQRDNKTALYIKLTNGLLVPANTNGETASGLYSYGNTIRKVLFDGTNWSDAEIQNDIIDTAHIKNDAVTSDKIEDYAVIERKIADSAVASEKLVQGARKPIILTPNTTEVDEETYQKLLSEDVDVILKVGNQVRKGTFCTLTNVWDNNTVWNFNFTCFLSEGDYISNMFVFGYNVAITKNSPHTCKITHANGSLSTFLHDSGYLDRTRLKPVLQEIDLTGTDAERKAKLDQFEKDWKTLTGASDLTGARFVGKIKSYNDDYSSVLFSLGTDGDNYLNNCYYAFTALSREDSTGAGDYMASVLVAVERSNGQMIYIEPTIDNVVKYNSQGGITLSNEADTMTAYANQRIVSNYDYDEDRGDYLSRIKFEADGYSSVTVGGIDMPKISTDAANKAYVDNIQLQNTKSLEAITIKTGNTTTDKTDNKAAIQAYIDNLKALGVDITKGYSVPCKYNDNNYIGVCFPTSTNSMRLCGIKPVDTTTGVFVVIETDGTYKTEQILTVNKNLSSLTTTSKNIAGAINEVNTLAKGKQDTLTSGTNIKTVNGQSLLGSGDIAISGGSSDVTAAGNNIFTGDNVFKTYTEFKQGVFIHNENLNQSYYLSINTDGRFWISNADDADVEVTGVDTPTQDNAAANKSYVDTQISTALGTVLTQLQNI